MTLIDRACGAGGVAATPHQPPASLSPDADELRLSLVSEADITLEGTRLHLFRKELAHLRKLRHVDPHVVLDRRRGQTWGRVLLSSPSMTFTSRAQVDHNRDAQADRYPRELAVPQANLVRYEHVECWPRQIARLGGAALPETFRHFTGGHLHNVFLHWASREYGRRPAQRATRVLAGDYFFLASEYPHHFGHVMTEMLPRLWGWWHLKAERPGLKALVGVERPGAVLRPFVRTLLCAAGIQDADVVPVGAATLVEHLYAATPQFANPLFAHPDLVRTWERVSAGLRAMAGDNRVQPRGDRIFVARPEDLKRTCHNAREVEGVFVDRGFTLVRPETLPIEQQAAMFWNADVVAGFAGSAMCNAVLGRPGTKVLLSSTSYTAANEYLNSAVLGDDLHIVWGTPDVDHPPGRWSPEAVNSAFAVDMVDGPGVRGLSTVLDQAVG